MKKVFISEFLKERKIVGAIAPSSKFLMKRMLSNTDFTEDINIIELGPGTGVFTAEILKRMTKGSKLISFEINSRFYDQLRSKFSDDRLKLLCDSAENIHKHLNNDELDQVKVVISSLPLAVIPNNIKNNILDSVVEIIEKDGCFIQFQYSLNAKKLLQSKFEKVNIDFTALNLPPAFVYHCSN